MVICLDRGGDLHMAQLMPLPLTVSCFSKIQIGLPFWYRLTGVVPEKGPLNGCVCLYHVLPFWQNKDIDSCCFVICHIISAFFITVKVLKC